MVKIEFELKKYICNEMYTCVLSIGNVHMHSKSRSTL